MPAAGYAERALTGVTGDRRGQKVLRTWTQCWVFWV